MRFAKNFRLNDWPIRLLIINPIHAIMLFGQRRTQNSIRLANHNQTFLKRRNLTFTIRLETNSICRVECNVGENKLCRVKTAYFRIRRQYCKCLKSGLFQWHKLQKLSALSFHLFYSLNQNQCNSQLDNKQTS